MDEAEVRAFLKKKLGEIQDPEQQLRMQNIMICTYIDKHFYKFERRYRDYLVMECFYCGKIKDVHSSYWRFLTTVPGAVLEHDSKFIK